MTIGPADELTTAVHELRALVAAQTQQIAQLHARLDAVALLAVEAIGPSPAGAPGSLSDATPHLHHQFVDELPVSSDFPVTGRRRFLALAAGAAAAVTTAARGAAPVAALNGNGNEWSLAGGNTVSPGVATVTTLIDYSPALPSQVDYLRVTDGASTPAFDLLFSRYIPAAVAGHARTVAATRVMTGVTGYSEVDGGNGVVGLATGPGGSYGVYGISQTGNGVVGHSTSGYDFFGEGAGRIGLSPHVGLGPPQSGIYAAADVISDTQGALWSCVVAGAPGVWRKLAGPTTAGSLHTVTPTRVYDSRSPQPLPGMLDTNQPRTISVADGRKPISGNVQTVDLVPPGATAIACNITITETIGSGFATVNPGINEVISASTINWSHSDQTMANGIIVGIDEERRITLIAGGGGSTHIIVDITGYFL